MHKLNQDAAEVTVVIVQFVMGGGGGGVWFRMLWYINSILPSVTVSKESNLTPTASPALRRNT